VLTITIKLNFKSFCFYQSLLWFSKQSPSCKNNQSPYSKQIIDNNMMLSLHIGNKKRLLSDCRSLESLQQKPVLTTSSVRKKIIPQEDVATLLSHLTTGFIRSNVQILLLVLISISAVDLLQMLHPLLPVYKNELPFVDLVMYTTPCHFLHQQ
jgi:hypothetical protein